MDEAQELHLIGQPQLHRRGKTLEELATEEIDRDKLNLAKAGKKQVLKAGYAFALFDEKNSDDSQRRFGLISMVGFSCSLMCTWEGLLA